MPRLPSVETMMANDEASRALGIELIDQDEGRAVTRMTVRRDMVNGHAMAHGGLIFTLADTAFACACNSFGPVTVAASAEIVFVAPARAGDVLVAEAVLRTRFGRSGVYDVTVRRDGDVIAEFRGRSHQLGPGLVTKPVDRGAAAGRPGHDLASVLAVAVELFNERGYDGTSMGDLAAGLGIAKSAIYHHVASKEELLSLALDRALDGLVAVTSRRPRAPRPGRRAPGVPGPGQRRGARGRVAVRHAAAAGPRQHRRRAGRAGPAAVPSTGSWPSWWPRPCATATSARRRPDAHRPAAVRPGQLASSSGTGRTAGRTTAPLADAICALAFDGLRARRPRPVRR